MKSDPAYEALRQQIEHDMRAEKARRGRTLFQLNATLFGLLMAVAWWLFLPVIGADESGRTLIVMAILSILGAVQVGIHWIAYRLGNSDAERLLREALREMVGAEAAKEKAKRHLDVDGTRLEIHDDEIDAGLSQTDADLKRQIKR